MRTWGQATPAHLTLWLADWSPSGCWSATGPLPVERSVHLALGEPTDREGFGRVPASGLLVLEVQDGGPCRTQATSGTGARRRQRSSWRRVSWAQTVFLIAFQLVAEALGEGRMWEPNLPSGDAVGDWLLLQEARLRWARGWDRTSTRMEVFRPEGMRAGTFDQDKTGPLTRISVRPEGMHAGTLDQDKCSDPRACALVPDVDQDGSVQRWSTPGLPVQALGLGGWVRKEGPGPDLGWPASLPTCWCGWDIALEPSSPTS